MREWTRVTACPECGGRLKLSEFYTFSRDYDITKKGRMSKRYTKGEAGPIDCITAYCADCNAVWDASKVCIESDDSVLLRVEG